MAGGFYSRLPSSGTESPSKRKTAPQDAVFLVASAALLQHHFFIFFQIVADYLGFGAVGDADLHVHLAFAVLAFGIHQLDRRMLVFVVDDGAFGNDDGVLVLVQDDLGVRRHAGFQFALRVIDRDAYFKGGYVIFFGAHR